MTSLPTGQQLHSIEQKVGHFLQLATITKPRTTLATGLAKLVLKMQLERICEVLYSQVGWINTETAKQFVAKQLPPIGLIMGIGLGAYRLCEQEKKTALLEILSGTLTCFPGAGTAVAVAIDSGLFIHDSWNRKVVIKKLDAAAIKAGQRLFSLNHLEQMTTTAVVSAFKDLSQELDLNQRLNDSKVLHKRYSKVHQQLDLAKDILIGHINRKRLMHDNTPIAMEK
ncbi:MAG: hypothetical protein AAF443_04790 [Chlamydiota bacterium]